MFAYLHEIRIYFFSLLCFFTGCYKNNRTITDTTNLFQRHVIIFCKFRIWLTEQLFNKLFVRATKLTHTKLLLRLCFYEWSLLFTLNSDHCTHKQKEIHSRDNSKNCICLTKRINMIFFENWISLFPIIYVSMMMFSPWCVSQWKVFPNQAKL